MTDQPREACGVFGIYAPGVDVARITFFGLHALQHRGQESAGIATSDGETIHVHTGMGLVAQVFDESRLGPLTGFLAVGHTRYSTTGSSRLVNAQPVRAEGDLGPLALAHNGNVINSAYLRNELEAKGCTFSGSSDSEVIAQLIATSYGETWVDKIRTAMGRLQGAYSIVLATREAVYAFRDPLGVRPLCLGQIEGGWVFASETCALDNTGAEVVREIEPGEILVADFNGLTVHPGSRQDRRALCVFEHIYFARPDSVIDDRLLYQAREAMGAELAREYPVEADLVIAIPDSATAAGLGYARESGIPFSEGLLKNRYVGRTFIQPDQQLRETGARLKYNPMRAVIEGKRLVVVDDSIVRGTTTPRVVSLLRKAGAKEVHLRICAPPIVEPCYFGVDMATRQELIAAQRTIPEIREYVDADSLGYL
ncbi:MAG TPA: amidophosphoribosyltransferase, partial [Dehalococcoidia bacterium]|nr:amidophosphoribosyltransferase [Dehalococcoidia bacterium]